MEMHRKGKPMSDLISRQAVLDKAYPYGNGDAPEGFCVDVEDIQALPSAEPEQHWIPCSERMPEEVGYYLVTLARDSEIDIAYFTKYNTWETFRNTEVIAWMPLPEPYTERSKDE